MTQPFPLPIKTPSATLSPSSDSRDDYMSNRSTFPKYGEGSCTEDSAKQNSRTQRAKTGKSSGRRKKLSEEEKMTRRQRCQRNYHVKQQRLRQMCENSVMQLKMECAGFERSNHILRDLVLVARTNLASDRMRLTQQCAEMFREPYDPFSPMCEKQRAFCYQLCQPGCVVESDGVIIPKSYWNFYKLMSMLLKMKRTVLSYSMTPSGEVVTTNWRVCLFNSPDSIRAMYPRLEQRAPHIFSMLANKSYDVNISVLFFFTNTKLDRISMHSNHTLAICDALSNPALVAQIPSEIDYESMAKEYTKLRAKMSTNVDN